MEVSVSKGIRNKDSRAHIGRLNSERKETAKRGEPWQEVT